MIREPIIVGISASHDASACVLRGGEVLAAPPFLALCELAQAHVEPAVRDLWRTKTGREAADVELDGYRLMYGLAWIGP